MEASRCSSSDLGVDASTSILCYLGEGARVLSDPVDRPESGIDIL